MPKQSLTAAPWMRGVDVNAESSVSVLPKSIIAGNFDLSGRGLVIGSNFASSLKSVRRRPRFDLFAGGFGKNEGYCAARQTRKRFCRTITP